MKRFYTIFLLSLITSFGPQIGLAQPVTPPPNPPENPDPSSFLPSLERPLSPIQRRKLSEYLDKRHDEARAKYNAGQDTEAFAIWYEEIKLRHYLGASAEVKTLGQVGLAAWNRDRTEDVKNITKQLKMIQKEEVETKKTTDTELLSALGIAYEQVRAFDNALIVYNKLLTQSRSDQNIVAQEATLNKIGELHLTRFDYQKAAPVYEELLTIAKSQANSLKEGVYLQKLAEIYRESLQSANAVRINEERVESYLKNQQVQPIPDLKIQIGLDYQALKNPNKASQNFQEAYSLAFALQQFGIAGEALNKLAELYQSYQQTDYALQIYQELIKIQEISYNYYGLMNTYDKIGQIYLARKDFTQAKIAFQKGAELASAIRYREEYFQTKIAQVDQAINTPEPAQNQPSP